MALFRVEGIPRHPYLGEKTVDFVRALSYDRAIKKVKPTLGKIWTAYRMFPRQNICNHYVDENGVAWLFDDEGCLYPDYSFYS